ncbi:ATP-binding protein [Streptomyces sulphureus]|uniref:ATP-binding protein n=1 Tax=Streptomyces sulphureus TaxID=47758 RepID=UPI0003681569|nr:tetratricopeptide repeat protein [Streptomyces sulphureus]
MAGEEREPPPLAGDRGEAEQPRGSVFSGAAAEVVQARDVSGGVHFHARPQSPEAPRPRQLPVGAGVFVNRGSELHRLDGLLRPGTGTAPICVLAGTAGVGKTSLALHWAHRASGHFPDGQLYVNLRGYAPGAPVQPAQALTGFLTALDVPSRAVPADPEAAAGLYRSLLADRRVLVVLDNAASTAQIRPLLPGTPSSLALVTSRSRLSGLAVREGAFRLTLDTLREGEAVALLRTVTSAHRRADRPESLAELARLCARLPLALRIAAERAAARPHLGIEHLVRDLRDESALWEVLTIGEDEEEEAVRTVFACSYRALPPEAARLFRLLGTHPGPEFGTAAAAAVGGVGSSRAEQLLDTLVGSHLLEQRAPDRYEFHDLLRAYAADRARLDESPPERAAALHRALSWYLHTADAAQAVLNPHEARVTLLPPVPGTTPAAFADHTAAYEWYQRERANLLAAVRAAVASGDDRTAWQLPLVLRSIHMLHNPFEEWFTLSGLGLEAARREGDRKAEAELLESLGMAHTQAHRLEEAAEHHTAALRLRRTLGERSNVALSLNDLGLTRLRSRSLCEAADWFTQAEALFEELGDAGWVATVRGNLAEVHYEQGRLDRAEPALLRTLEEHRRRSARGGEGNVLRLLSAVFRESGREAEALGAARKAVGIARRSQNRMWEAYWLLDQAAAQRALGDTESALASLHRSTALHHDLGDQAREARARHATGSLLRSLGRPTEAADLHRQAAGVHRANGDRWQLSLALIGLAAALRAGPSATDSGGQPPDEAAAHLAEASRLLATFDDARAAKVSARLEEWR